METAILLMAHGSRISEANDAALEIAGMLKELTQFKIVETSFREMHLPDIQTGIDRCVAQGAKRILLVPYFLFMGAHVRHDLPEEIEESKKRHPDVQFSMAQHLGVDIKLAELLTKRVNEGLFAAGWES